MRNATSVLGLGRVHRGVADRCVAPRSKATHRRRRSCVSRALLETGARRLMLHTHYLWRVAGGCVVAAGDH